MKELPPSDLANKATKEIAAECRKWTRRCDDAKRIPDAIFDFAPAIIQKAIDAATQPATPAAEVACYLTEEDDPAEHDLQRYSAVCGKCYGALADLERAARLEVSRLSEPRPCPLSGETRLCMICAYEKPWGVFDAKTGAAVCIECRDKARA